MTTIATNDHLIELIINDPIYDIRADGTIWAAKPKSGPRVAGKIYPWRRVDRLATDKKRYVVTYRFEGQDIHKHINLVVSRIIYRKFNGPLDPLLEINHIDGIKSNNIPSKLELLTFSKNMEHSVKLELVPKGERCNSILTEFDVIQIKKLIACGTSNMEIARQFNVHHDTIGCIKRCKSWIHIK